MRRGRGGTGPGNADIGVIGEEESEERTRGNEGIRGFDVDGAGGMGSERECKLDVGDPATGRENTELVFMTGRTTRGGGEVDEEPGRGGIGGGSSWECWPCGRWDTCEAYDEAGGGGPRAKEGP